MNRENVLYHLDTGVVTLTLNRADARNAISRALLADLESALEEAESTPDARAVVVTGAGKAFCAGADLKERAGMSHEEVDAFLKTLNRLFSAIENFKLPVIAAVNGAAFGGGLEAHRGLALVGLHVDA